MVEQKGGTLTESLGTDLMLLTVLTTNPSVSWFVLMMKWFVNLLLKRYFDMVREDVELVKVQG